MKTIAILLALAFVLSPALASSVDGIDTIIDKVVNNTFADEDLSAAPQTSSISKFLAGSGNEGLPPENMTNKPPMQYVGSSVKYQPVDVKYYTPAELESLKNTSTWLEILP